MKALYTYQFFNITIRRELPLTYEHKADKFVELLEVLSGIKMLTEHAGRKSTLSAHPKTHAVKVPSGASQVISVVTLLAILTKCHRVLSCLHLLVFLSHDNICSAEEGKFRLELHARHIWI